MPKHTKQVTEQPLTLSSISDLLDQKLYAFEGKFDQKFEAIDQRFDQVDLKFNKIDQRLDGIDQRLGGVDERLDGMDKRFGEMDKRFGELDKRFDGIEGTLNRTVNLVVDLKQDMEIVKDFLATEVMTKTDGREIMNTVDAMVTYQKKFDQELTLQGHRITELTKTSDRHTKEIKDFQLATV